LGKHPRNCILFVLSGCSIKNIYDAFYVHCAYLWNYRNLLYEYFLIKLFFSYIVRWGEVVYCNFCRSILSCNRHIVSWKRMVSLKFKTFLKILRPARVLIYEYVWYFFKYSFLVFYW
jgi:hypothetical protein